MASVVLSEPCDHGDAVIKVGDDEIIVSKFNLGDCSWYFRILFASTRTKSEQQVYNIPGVSPEIMHLINNYANTHFVPVTQDNVEELLATADQFLIPGVVRACFVFLENHLCPENCIGIWRLLDFYRYLNLRSKIFLYILDHFQEIVYVSKEYLELPVQQLAAIIENDHLNVKQENIVFEAILHWINHLPDQRRGHRSMLWLKVYSADHYHSSFHETPCGGGRVMEPQSQTYGVQNMHTDHDTMEPGSLVC